MRREHKTLLGLGAALVVALAVAAVILLFGIRRPPAFPSLADQPDEAVEGWLLFNRSDGDETCLMMRAAGGGEEHQINCSSGFTNYVKEATVDSDGRILVSFLDATHLTVDPDTGEIIDRTGGSIDDSSTAYEFTPRLERSDGALVEVSNDWDGSAQVIVRNGSAERTILEVTGPADYGLYNAEWSPDGKWVIAVDSQDRYLLIDADGDTPTRILLSDVADWEVTWVQPPSTTAPAANTDDPATQAQASELAALAQDLPMIAGYSYGEMLPFSLWGLGAGSTGLSRPVLGDGAWVAEVSVASADLGTAEAWSAFVNDHHSELTVLRDEPEMAGDERVVSAMNGVPAWERINDELVLNAVIDADWAGVWYHDGLVWGVSGPEAQARVYAERLIEQQGATGSEPEPEQTDIDVLEGPLAELAVEVPGFMYVDAPHQQVLDTLSQLGDCQDHVSQHTIHPADDPDPINTVDDDDISVTMTLWSDLPGCDSGQWFVTDLIENRGFVPVEGGAAASTDGTTIVWVAETGAMVQAIGADVAALESYRPVLEAIAEASSAFAGATPSSAVQIVVPGFEGPFEATGSAVDQGMVCGSGDVVTTSTTERGRADRLTVSKEFTCDDGSGTLSAVLKVQLYSAQGATFTWEIIGGTGDYEDLQGSGSGFVEDPDTDIYQGRLRIS